MDNETEVTPALTADEWKNPSLALGGYADLFIYGKRAAPRELHALAALALHKQPFGFTHEDVAMLEESSRDDHDCYENWERLRNLAARIAALLPPNGH